MIKPVTVSIDVPHDIDAVCARCEASRSHRFPLAPKRQIHDILGYV